MRPTNKQRTRKTTNSTLRSRTTGSALQSSKNRLSSLASLTPPRSLSSTSRSMSYSPQSSFTRQYSPQVLKRPTGVFSKNTAVMAPPSSTMWSSMAALGTSLFSFSQPFRLFSTYDKKPSDLETRYKRLVYQSQQRGWLELDMIIGTYVRENREKLMNEKSLDELTKVTDLDNNNLIRWLIEGQPVCL